MISKAIIDSARFIKMPQEAQALYFHLCIRADDDGVVEAYNVMQLIGTSEDNIRILNAKGLIKILNEDLVTYIIDWNEHNNIRADRKIDSIYKNLLIQVVPDAELIEPKPRSDVKNDSRLNPDRPLAVHGPLRLGEDRIGKDMIGKVGPSPSAPASDIQYVPLEEDIRGLRKKEIKEDPELTVKRDLIGFFIRKSKEYHNDYCPVIQYPVALRLVKSCLDFSNPTEIKQWIEWYLQSELYEVLGSDIKTCLCTASFNKYKDYRRKHD